MILNTTNTNKESIIKLLLLVGFLTLFLSASRFQAEFKKVICIEGKCDKPHDHGQLGYHERFIIYPQDNYAIATLKGCANFWEANATGMTFAIIIGAAALSLLLSWNKFEQLIQLTGIKGSIIGSVFGMPLNMCANCSAVTSISVTSEKGSTEATLGIILGGALLNIIGIITMFGIFNPAIVISRIIFSIIMILYVIPKISKSITKKETIVMKSEVFEKISCYFSEKSIVQTIIKALEDWLIAVGTIAYKLIPLLIIGTICTALFRAFFPNEILKSILAFNPYIVLIIISFIGTMLSVPVLFEILLGTILVQLGFTNGIIAAMLFTAPSYGLFTVILTKEKLGGYKIPLILLAITFIFGIFTGLLADYLTPLF